MTANRELATELRRQADECMRQRKALLCAAVALDESRSIPAAVKILRDHQLPDGIADAAVAVLEQVAHDVPARGGAVQEGNTR